MGVGVGKTGAHGRQLRFIAGGNITAAFLIGAVDCGGCLKSDRLVGQPGIRERCRQVLLGGRPGGHADGRAIHVLQGCDTAICADEESLAVVEGGHGEVAPFRVALGGPGHVAGNEVNLACLQNRSAVGRGNRHELDGFGVAQNGGGNSPAQVNIEADVAAVRIQVSETKQFGVYAANYFAAFAHARGNRAVPLRLGNDGFAGDFDRHNNGFLDGHSLAGRCGGCASASRKGKAEDNQHCQDRKCFTHVLLLWS